MDPNPNAPFAEQMLKAIRSYANTVEEVRGMIEVGDTVDRDRLGALKAKYANYIAQGNPSGPSKYLDIAYWIGVKYELASRLGLAQGPNKSILDLGTGAGHFIAIAQRLGHRAIGTDVDVPLYAEIADLLGVKRIIQGVYRQTPLPNLEDKFDLVTALMISFNSIVHQIPRIYWSIEDWKYLINDIIYNQLRIPGRIFFILIKIKRMTGLITPMFAS